MSAMLRSHNDSTALCDVELQTHRQRPKPASRSCRAFGGNTLRPGVENLFTCCRYRFVPVRVASAARPDRRHPFQCTRSCHRRGLLSASAKLAHPEGSSGSNSWRNAHPSKPWTPTDNGAAHLHLDVRLRPRGCVAFRQSLADCTRILGFGTAWPVLELKGGAGYIPFAPQYLTVKAEANARKWCQARGVIVVTSWP